MIRRSNSGSTSGSVKAQLRNRLRGVRFLTPTKSKSPEDIKNDDRDDTSDIKRDGLNNTEQTTTSMEDVNGHSRSNDLLSQVSADSGNTNDRQNVGSIERVTEIVSSENHCLQTPGIVQPSPSRLLVQTTLATVANPVHNVRSQRTCTSKTDGAVVVKSKYFTGKKLSSNMSLQQPITCARMLPMDLMKLKRNGHVQPATDKDDGATCIMEDTAVHKTSVTKDSREGSGSASEHVKRSTAVEEAAKIVPLQEESDQSAGQMSGGEVVGGERGVVGDMRIRVGQSGNNTDNDTIAFMEMESVILSDRGGQEQSLEAGGQIRNNHSRSNSPQGPNAVGTSFRAVLSDQHKGPNVITTSELESNDNAVSVAPLSPLPKLGTRKDTAAMFGRDTHQRRQISSISNGSGLKRKFLFTDQLDSSTSCMTCSSHDCSSSNFLPEHTAKRLKRNDDDDNKPEEDKTGDQSIMRPSRVLPSYLQPGHSWPGFESQYSRQLQLRRSRCVCGSKNIKWVALCGECRSTVTQLKKKGLFKRPPELDSDSPQVLQVSILHTVVSMDVEFQTWGGVGGGQGSLSLVAKFVIWVYCQN